MLFDGHRSYGGAHITYGTPVVPAGAGHLSAGTRNEADVETCAAASVDPDICTVSSKRLPLGTSTVGVSVDHSNWGDFCCSGHRDTVVAEAIAVKRHLTTPCLCGKEKKNSYSLGI